MSLFGDNEGKIVTLGNTGMPALINLSGVTGVNKVLVMGMGFGQGANVQFMHTLKDAIYVYAFGERMGQIKISGLLLFRSCGGGGGGLPSIVNYYKSNSVSLNGRPLRISLSTQVLKGFLVGIEFGGLDPIMGTAQFSLIFASLPVE